MSKEVVCDYCRVYEDREEIRNYRVLKGSRRTLAGDTEDIWERIDLCPVCAGRVSRTILVWASRSGDEKLCKYLAEKLSWAKDIKIDVSKQGFETPYRRGKGRA